MYKSLPKSVLNAMCDGTRILVIEGPDGVGKAQPLDSLIRVPEGWSLMGDIVVGREVVCSDGSTAKVTGVFPQGKKEIFRITFSDGRKVECCEEHLWKIYNYNWEPAGHSWKIMSLKEIMYYFQERKCRDGLYIQLTEPFDVVDKQLPIDPYLLGAILGDGGLTGRGIHFCNPDKFIIHKLQEVMPSDCDFSESSPINYRIRKKNKKLQPNTKCSLEIAMENLGLMNKYSHEKIIPDIYMTTSISQKISLLQGLMDTDGTVGKNGAISYCTTSNKLALQVQYLIRSLGGMATITSRYTNYTHNGEKRRGRLSFHIRIRIKDPKRIFSLPRKKDRISDQYQYNDQLRLRIKSIELVGEKEAQCIMIDHPDHLYVTNDYIVTHNTTLVTKATDLFEEYGKKLIKVRCPDNRGDAVIRQVIMSNGVAQHPMCQSFLFLADFVYAYESIILPHKDDKNVVFVFDRFILSTSVYQKLSLNDINLAMSLLAPDFCIAFKDAKYVYMDPTDLDRHAERLASKSAEETNHLDPVGFDAMVNQIETYRQLRRDHEILGVLGSKHIEHFEVT